jgi:hypothetical protein
MDSFIGVAHASMLGAFQTAGGRREASKAALRKQQKATGFSSNGMALSQVDEDAKEAEFEITSFKLPKAESLNINRHLQRRYQDGVFVASRVALKAEAAARLARLRQKKLDHSRLCAARCDKYNECIKIKPFRSEAGFQAQLAVYGKGAKGAEALSDKNRVSQQRLKDH